MAPRRHVMAAWRQKQAPASSAAYRFLLLRMVVGAACIMSLARRREKILDYSREFRGRS